MADADLALSLAMVSLLDLLSKSKDIIADQSLTDQISRSIRSLQRIMNGRHAYHNHQPDYCDVSLWATASNAEKAAQELIVQLLRDYMSKSQLDRFFSRTDGVRAKENMATKFRDRVELPFKQLEPPPSLAPDPNAPPPADANTPPPEPLLFSERVESHIVGRDQSVNLLVAELINPSPPPPDANAPPPDPNIPPGNANAPPPVRPPDPNSPLQVIAVVGRKNCGKTALVRSVFNMLKIKHHFDCRAWVHVTGLGAESWTESLLVEILLQMPVGDQLKDLKHKNKEQLFDMLYGLLMEKRYLIVLDNLGAQPFNDFLRPFADVNNGSRVIVTSTNEAMQNLVDPRVDGLKLCPKFTDEDCKTLLRDSFTEGGGISEELVTSILVKCGGSAPAISLLGGLLSAVKENRRVALVTRLGEPAPLDDFLRLSFDELPYQMKPCVLYMALFPKESDVPTRRLFRLWAAEGFLLTEAAADGSVQMRSAEDCFRELERRNLISVVRWNPDTSARSCRMPAFLYEFFHEKAKASALLQIHQPSQAQNTATGHYDYMVRYLRSFASFNTCKPGTQQAREIKVLLNSPIIDGGRDLLKVLDLEGVYKPVLPKKFENILPNLRYLGLRWTALDSIPESVGNLLLLETLDLKYTNITKVTSAIWNAKNLRHLYLSEASFDGSIPRHISSGSKLETLWGLFIENDKSPMISVLPKLKSLKKLGVTCRPGAVSAVARCISRLTGLKSLRLRSRDLFGHPAVLRLCNMEGLKHLSNLYLLGSLRPEHNPCLVLPLNLKRLTLSMSGCKGDPMPVLQSLNHLIDLRLLARSCSTKKLHCNAGFPKLLVLKIWMLEELEELKVEQGAMCNLKELDIRQCKELKEVTGLIHINSLKFVSLTRVKKVLEDSFRSGFGVHQDALVKTTELLREVKFTITIMLFVISIINEKCKFTLLCTI